MTTRWIMSGSAAVSALMVSAVVCAAAPASPSASSTARTTPIRDAALPKHAVSSTVDGSITSASLEASPQAVTLMTKTGQAWTFDLDPKLTMVELPTDHKVALGAMTHAAAAALLSVGNRVRVGYRSALDRQQALLIRALPTAASKQPAAKHPIAPSHAAPAAH